MQTSRNEEIRCINCDSLDLKPISDVLYQCLECGEFTDSDEGSSFERIKQHKERAE